MARRKCPRGMKLGCVPKAAAGLGAPHDPSAKCTQLGLSSAEMAFRISEGYTDARKAGGTAFANSADAMGAAAVAAWEVTLREQQQGGDFWNNFDAIQLGDEIGRRLAEDGAVNVGDAIDALNRGF